MIQTELAQLRKKHFVCLILDNEVTVGHFVKDPPLAWLRLVQREGDFQVAPGYPTLLTRAQAQFEMTNWDQVSLPAIEHLLAQLGQGADFLVIGNNAGQGLPLARRVPDARVAAAAAVIYAERLPEKPEYEQLGFKNFWRRDQAVDFLIDHAAESGRPLALTLINTIQHNAGNYHQP